MRKSVWLLGLCCWSLSVLGQNDEALQRLLQTEGMKNAAVGICVRQVSDGRTVLEWQPDMALTPASVTKLLPTWFALQEKGKDFRYHTTIYYTGEIKEGVLAGNIFLEAKGDPTLDSRYFPDNSLVSALSDAICRKGIKKIRGKILVVGAKRGTDVPGSWVWEDVSNYYGALYLPFNYRDNTFTLQFQSGASGTAAKLSKIIPELPATEIRSEVKAAAENKDNAWIYGGPYSAVLYVKGSIPPNRTAFRVKGAIHDPGTVFVHELTNELRNKGIPVDGGQFPAVQKTELLKLSSPCLKEIVFQTNKASINLFAEALGQLAGGEHWPDKVQVLLKQVGIEASGLILKDACGLSSMNAVPARVFTELLVYIAGKKDDAFLVSLPVAGVDGGLSGYCYASPRLKNNVKAKTGSMTGVRCLAGYVTRKDGEQLAFTILVNHYVCTPAILQREVGKLLDSLIGGE